MPNTKKPIIAIMYDFDKTLSTNDMQSYSFIPSLGIDEKEFWTETDILAQNENMDRILAYLYMMLKKSKAKDIPIKRESFVKLGDKIEFFKGVEGWFDRINKYGEDHNVKIEHYIISSGLREIIEGCSIYKKFKRTYACEFLYDVNGIAVFPKNVVNFTTKTQFLYRINKGALDVWDDKAVNTYIDENKRRVPFRNMIYVGDGLTDVPCMKLVKANGGQSVAVYKKRNREMANNLLTDKRVDFITEADYSENSEFDNIIKTIINKMIIVDQLTEIHRKHKKAIFEK